MKIVIVPETRQEPGVLMVALVASDAALRSSVRLLLAVSGMEVHEYRTAEEFLATESRPFACLVIDCRLAGMPGQRLCLEAGRRDRHLPVVVLAACPAEFEFAKRLRPDIRVVGKPFQGDLLINTIEEAAGVDPDNRENDRAPPAPQPAVS